MDSPSERTAWLMDLIRLEIVLWNRLDRRLRDDTGVTLAQLEALWAIDARPDARLRVGDVADALRITVGGASKLVDRMERAGLVRREADPDRRASRIALTDRGRDSFRAAVAAGEAELGAATGSIIDPAGLARMHRLVRRLLAAAAEPSAPPVPTPGR